MMEMWVINLSPRSQGREDILFPRALAVSLWKPVAEDLLRQDMPDRAYEDSIGTRRTEKAHQCWGVAFVLLGRGMRLCQQGRNWPASPGRFLVKTAAK